MSEPEIPNFIRRQIEALRNRPTWLAPLASALHDAVAALDQHQCRILLLGCARRVAPFVDPALQRAPGASQAKPHAYSDAVDSLFDAALQNRAITPPPILHHYRREVAAARIGVAYGGQGDSLVEEILTPAMRLLEAVFTARGADLECEDEDGQPFAVPGYVCAFDVCRIVGAFLRPAPKRNDNDGIPPSILESLEKDALWHCIEALSQPVGDAREAFRYVTRYADVCRRQNIALTSANFRAYQHALDAN